MDSANYQSVPELCCTALGFWTTCCSEQANQDTDAYWCFRSAERHLTQTANLLVPFYHVPKKSSHHILFLTISWTQVHMLEQQWRHTTVTIEECNVVNINCLFTYIFLPTLASSLVGRIRLGYLGCTKKITCNTIASSERMIVSVLFFNSWSPYIFLQYWQCFTSRLG